MKDIILSCCVVVVACLAAVATVLIRDDRRHRPAHRLKQLPEYNLGSFQCQACHADGRPVRFLQAGDLLVHEIQAHPNNRPT